MSSVTLHLDRSACEPGDEISGRVDWNTGADRPDEVLISLLWHTAGKGTEDIEVVEQVRVEDPATFGSRNFSFRVPDFPWSFSGKLISLIWSVEASLEPKGDVERADLVAAPGGQEVLL